MYSIPQCYFYCVSVRVYLCLVCVCVGGVEEVRWGEWNIPEEELGRSSHYLHFTERVFIHKFFSLCHAHTHRWPGCQQPHRGPFSNKSVYHNYCFFALWLGFVPLRASLLSVHQRDAGWLAAPTNWMVPYLRCAPSTSAALHRGRWCGIWSMWMCDAASFIVWDQSLCNCNPTHPLMIFLGEKKGKGREGEGAGGRVWSPAPVFMRHPSGWQVSHSSGASPDLPLSPPPFFGIPLKLWWIDLTQQKWPRFFWLYVHRLGLGVYKMYLLFLWTYVWNTQWQILINSYFPKTSMCALICVLAFACGPTCVTLCVCGCISGCVCVCSLHKMLLELIKRPCGGQNHSSSWWTQAVT